MTTRTATPRSTTRDRALDAAHASILEIGTERTTMVEVSRRSGVGRTTLYRHWPDTAALTADLLTRELTVAVTRVDTSLADPAAPRDADRLADQLCALADQIRTDPLLDAVRRHEAGLLGEYILRRLGTSQRALIAHLSAVLAHTIATDSRMTGRDPDATATMLFLAVQGAVLSAPLADPPLDATTWRTELRRLIKGYLLP